MSFLTEKQILEKFEALEKRIAALELFRNIDVKDWATWVNTLRAEIEKLK